MAATSMNMWTAAERSSIMPFHFDDGTFHEQRVIYQKLDPENKDSLLFPLYYFIKDLTYQPREKSAEKPTILFVAGGPGQLILPDTENFVDMYGYRAVYFHFRGSGFSQVPASNEYDKDLTTSNIINDMEEIRKDVFGEKKSGKNSETHPWTAVIGHSYGAVAAYQYARLYKEQKVKKLVLSAPMIPASLPGWRGSASAEAEREDQTIVTLKKIYSRSDFNFLENHQKDGIVKKIVETSRIVSSIGLSLTSIVNDYVRLEKSLRQADLHYERNFYGAIRRLRHVGWLPLDVPYAKPLRTPKVDDTQVECGLVIADAILSKAGGPDVKTLLASHPSKDALMQKFTIGKEILGHESSLNTDRCFAAVSRNDGLTKRFMRESQEIKKLFPALGPAPKKPVSWNSTEAKPKMPTLILKGGADPVTEEVDAQHYFQHTLEGHRALIEFPGIGHAMALPDLGPSDHEKGSDLLKASVPRTRFWSSRDKLIDEFLTSNIDAFKTSAIVTALQTAFARATGRESFEVDVLRG